MTSAHSELQLGKVFPAGFVTLCIAFPRTGRKPKLPRQEGKQFCRRGLIRQQRTSRIPQKSELSSKTQTVLGSSPAANQAEIVIAEDVVFNQPGAIERDRFKSLTLRGGKKLTQRHSRAYLLSAAASPLVRARSREIVAG